MSISADILIILAPAFFAGALISLAHIPLGIEVLKRGIIFLDLAVAQCAALGMLAFHIYIDNEAMDPRYANVGSLIFGLVAAMICSLSLHTLEKKTEKYHEAIIGCTFILAASLSILIMSGDPHSNEQMKDILAGQILWVSWSDLQWSSLVFIGTWMLWLRLKDHRDKIFYPLFALTIPFSVNLIGVYLVFASLILPALATVSTLRGRALIAYILSICSFASGLLLSYFADFPSGPAIVLCMSIIAVTYYFVYRKYARNHGKAF